MGQSPLKTGIHGFALKGKHAEHAFVDPVERFLGDEALKRLHPQREFANGKRPLQTETLLRSRSRLCGAVYSVRR